MSLKEIVYVPIIHLVRLLQISDGTKRDIRTISDLTGIPQGESTGKAKPHLVYAMTFKPKAKVGLMTAGWTSCFHDGMPLAFFC